MDNKPIVQIILKRHVNYGDRFTSYIKKISDAVFKDEFKVIFTDEDVYLKSSDVPILTIKFVNERKIETSVEVNEIGILDGLTESLKYIIEKLKELKEETENDIPTT